MSNIRSLPQIPGLKVVPVPDLQDLLHSDDVPPFPFEKSFEEARGDPCIVLHTSGTTSLPKPIVLTHGQLAVFDAQWQIPPLEDREVFLRTIASCSLFLVALPFFHMAGFSMGIWLPLNPETSVFFASPSKPLSLLSIEQALDSARIGGAIIPPSLLQEAVDYGPVLEKLGRLNHVFYGGAPMPSEAGLALSSRTHLCNQTGSTECVVFTTHLTDRTDWDHFCFGSECSGYNFRQTDLPDVFELVIVRDDCKKDFQAVFQGNDLTEFSTEDLYSKHPSKPHHWKYQGRLDDVIILSHGEKLNPISNESLIGSHPLLTSAMYVGNGRYQPAVILEPDDQQALGLDTEQIIEVVWPLIEQANAASPSHGQLYKSHIIIADPSKKFLRTSKGTVRRAQTCAAFEPDIRAVYDVPVNTPKPTARVDVSDHDELQAFVHMVYQNITRFGSLQLDEDIFLKGADSLNIQGAVSALKASVFSPDIRVDTSWISQKAIYANPTARSMTKYLENLGRPQGSPTEPLLEQAEMLEEVYERYRVRLPGGEGKPAAETPTAAIVLLTGSTGTLGSYLLDALLRRGDVAEVICLNRTEDAAERQLKGNAEKGLCVDFSSPKVRFMHSDLSQHQLRLSQLDYDLILSKVTVILHNQWPVNFNLPLSSFEPQLQGTVNLVKFAVQASHRPSFFFVSSIAAVNNWRRQIHLGSPSYDIPERHFADLSLATHGYGQSKAIASDLLYYASSQCGLRGATVRLGQVAGPRGAGGVWNANEWLPSLVKTSRALGALPETIPLLDEVDWLPVDDAAQVIVELALDVPADTADPRRRTLALCNVANPKTVPWGALVPAVQASVVGDPLRVVPFPEWLDLLESSAAPVEWEDTTAAMPALKLLDFFRELEEGRRSDARQTLMQTEMTRKLSPRLAGVGAIDGSMMVNWLKQWGLKREGGSPSVDV